MYTALIGVSLPQAWKNKSHRRGQMIRQGPVPGWTRIFTVLSPPWVKCRAWISMFLHDAMVSEGGGAHSWTVLAKVVCTTDHLGRGCGMSRIMHI